jgi:hypothetical protein
VVIDPRLTKRMKNNDSKWIPLPLVMFLIRERGNVIDYEIPVSGNLKNPKFHFRDVILDMLANIFVKPPTTPYRNHVKHLENKIEKLLTLKWEMRQGQLMPNQEKFVKKMVDFLACNPGTSIDVYPMQYAEREKENILFFEAKKKYFLLSKNKNTPVLSKVDSLMIEQMSVKDPSFEKYLNKNVRVKGMFTVQEKCNKFIGLAIVNSKFDLLNKERENVFMLQFKKKSVENRVKIHTGENNIPYNGFSFFKIVYNGELPESLIKANKELNDLNDVSPRKKFEKEREESKN